MAVDVDELESWLALWRLSGVGPALFRKTLQRFPELSGVFQASDKVLASLGYTTKQLEDINKYKAYGNSECSLTIGVKRDLAWAQEPDHFIVRITDPDYPDLLRETVGAPPLLFVHGQLESLSLPQVAIVGSRHPTRAGLSCAHDFAQLFAQQGFITTSGLALGIDSAAHQGALDGGGKTIAVAAHGLDQIYPKRNKPLAEAIIAQGAIVSEFPIGVQPQPQFFPKRNRIISGLSMGVLVVEAALKSGSLITARQALEQGREVFAIPGSIHNPLAKGCHDLIRQGAKLVENGAHVIEELLPLLQYFQQQLPLDLKGLEQQAGPVEPSAKPVPGLGLEENSLMNQLVGLLDYEPMSIDEMVQKTGVCVADIRSTLVLLELEDRVELLAGGYRLASASKVG